MFSRLLRRFTYANVAATLAIVFAMSGGAYAAGHYLITSTKQISPKVLKTLKGASGKSGPAGPVGPAGPAGATGSQGLAGTAGGEGKEGKPGVEGKAGASVSSKELAEGNAHCAAGGSEFKAGAATSYACNGSPWTAGGTLPSGSTLKGEWTASRSVSGANVLSTAGSFGIPLAQAPTAHYIAEGEAPPAGCTGSASDPGAEKGNLCVFAAEEVNVKNEPPPGEFRPSVEYVTTTGFIVNGTSIEAGASFIYGTWAVTAE